MPMHAHLPPTACRIARAKQANLQQQAAAYVAVHHGIAGKGSGLDAQRDAGAGATLGLRERRKAGARQVTHR